MNNTSNKKGFITQLVSNYFRKEQNNQNEKQLFLKPQFLMIPVKKIFQSTSVGKRRGTQTKQIQNFQQLHKNDDKYNKNWQTEQTDRYDINLLQNIDQKLQADKIKQNIFSTDNIEKTENNLVQNGPLYDQEGNVIERSMVGKYEWYKRMSEIENPNPNKRNIKLSILNLSSYEKNKAHQKMIQIQQEQIKKQKILSEITIEHQMAEQLNNNIKQSKLKFTKQQILQLIDLKEKKLNQNNQQDIKDVNGQEKTLQKFQNIQNEWVKISRDLCKNLKIKDGQTLIERSQENFRKKKELQDLIDKTKNTDLSPIFLWESQLRENTDSISSNQSKVNGIYSKSKGIQICRTKKNLENFEIIRRNTTAQQQICPLDTSLSNQKNIFLKTSFTNQSKQSSTTQRNLWQSSNSFKFMRNSNSQNELLLKELAQNSQKQPLINQILNIEYEDLYIEGQNQLQREKQSILKDDDKTLYNRYYFQDSQMQKNTKKLNKIQIQKQKQNDQNDLKLLQ